MLKANAIVIGTALEGVASKAADKSRVRSVLTRDVPQLLEVLGTLYRIPMVLGTMVLGLVVVVIVGGRVAGLGMASLTLFLPLSILIARRLNRIARNLYKVKVGRSETIAHWIDYEAARRLGTFRGSCGLLPDGRSR